MSEHEGKIYEDGEIFWVGRTQVKCKECLIEQCVECFFQDRNDCPQCFASWRPDGKYMNFIKVVDYEG